MTPFQKITERYHLAVEQDDAKRWFDLALKVIVSRINRANRLRRSK